MTDPSRITIERLSDYTFTVQFFNDAHITTTVTTTDDVVTEWVNHVFFIQQCHGSRLIVGLDIDWRPKINGHQDKSVAMFKLCVGDLCLVFRFLPHRNLPNALFNLLSSRQFIFVGVWNNGDYEELFLNYQIRMLNAYDLRMVAVEKSGRGEMLGMLLTGLAREVLGREVEKPRGLRHAMWEHMSLNVEQIMYACVDAFLVLQIGRQLL
ncbi:hypothetical protein QJS04_geneDACA022289 [Acorus gramineus]|uniref:3'-5' exonuclease domain-containing protein n=1 Tax=Acorus gramineus TaxID=55184 RepID=A0AAV9BCF4_ACOGR|nr:hypothetical protein QJS04_geneDACA022289 [Acorus gramineus]